MEIFKWVEEIEKIYDDLIEKAKKESLNEIQKARASQEKEMEKLIRNNQEIINDALAKVNHEVNEKSRNFEELITNLCSKIEKYYQKNKTGLTSILFEKLGFDF
jgi:F0F1-type ATP synthase membrane subunit b/b'